MNEPSRRRVLASLPVVAGLAGCAARRPTATGSPTDTPDRSPASPSSPDPSPDPGEATPTGDAILWRYPTSEPVDQPPVVADGTVYAATGEMVSTPTPTGSLGGGLLALSAADGSKEWRDELAQPPAGEPAVRDDGVYVVTGVSAGYYGVNQRLRKVAHGGGERWHTDPVDQFLTLLAFGGGRAYLGTNDDALGDESQPLFAVDVDDGGESWSTESGDAFEGRYRDGILLVSSALLALHAYDATDGSLRWTADGQPLSNDRDEFALLDDMAFVASEVDPGERFTAVSLSDGSRRWSYGDDAAGPFVPTGAAAGDGVVVGTEFDGRVFGLDPADGAERWRRETAGDVRNPPLVADGTAYVGDVSGRAYAFDAVDGTERWRSRVGGVVDRVAPTGDTVVVASHTRREERLTGLDAADGTERWRFSTTGDVSRAAVAGGRAYVAAADQILALGES